MRHAKPARHTAVVVEDDDIQRDMLALLLEESNYDVIQCEDAETASAALKARHPSLLITDVNLTGRMNGIELAYLARQSDPSMRVVVISGRPLATELPEGVRFFAKPFYPTTLLREAVPSIS